MIVTARASIQAALVAFILGCAMAPDADAASAVTNREVAKHLTEAKKLAASKRWDAALAALGKADRVPGGSAYAEYKIDEFRAYVLTQQRKYTEAGQLFERLAKSDLASADIRIAHLKTASQLYLRAKQYDESARAAETALNSRPDNAELLQLAGQAQYLAGDYRGAIESIGKLVAAAERAGDKPQEESLQILLNSHYRLSDREQIARTWETLLRHYPQPDYWRNVLDLKQAQPHDEQVELYYLALTFDVGVLDDAEDFETLALGAIDLGLPSTAVRVLEAGLRDGILAGATDETRFRRMLSHARAEAAKASTMLPDWARHAQRVSSGQLDVELGRVYLSEQQYDRAITALRRGIGKGGLRDPDQARIDLGEAYLKNGKSREASQAFATVTADSDWRELADLWALRVREASERNETARR